MFKRALGACVKLLETEHAWVNYLCAYDNTWIKNDYVENIGLNDNPRVL